MTYKIFVFESRHNLSNNASTFPYYKIPVCLFFFTVFWKSKCIMSCWDLQIILQNTFWSKVVTNIICLGVTIFYIGFDTANLISSVQQNFYRVIFPNICLLYLFVCLFFFLVFFFIRKIISIKYWPFQLFSTVKTIIGIDFTSRAVVIKVT